MTESGVSTNYNGAVLENNSMAGWNVITVERDRTVHVVPVDDVTLHTYSASCQCLPKVDGEVITHRAFDLREYFEEEGVEC